MSKEKKGKGLKLTQALLRDMASRAATPDIHEPGPTLPKRDKDNSWYIQQLVDTARAQNVHADSEEEALCRTLVIPDANRLLPTGSFRGLEVQRRHDAAEHFMRNTKNPDYRAKINLMNFLVAQHLLTLGLATENVYAQSSRGRIRVGGGIHPVIEGGHMRWQGAIPANDTLQTGNLIDHVSVLAHELAHVEEDIRLLASIEAQTDEERLALFVQRNTPTREAVMQEEQQITYPLTARAYLYEAGMAGAEAIMTSSRLPYETFVFVNSGCDVTNPIWAEYIDQVTGKEYRSI